MSKQKHTQLWIEKGATISNNGREYVILALADINMVLAKEVGTNERVLLNVDGVGFPKVIGESDPEPAAERDLSSVFAEDWRIAEERRQYIDPLLRGNKRRGKALGEQIAKEAGVSRATVYRWYAEFTRTGLLSSLLPKTENKGGKGKKRLRAEVEAIIEDCIENFHDTDQNPTIAATVTEIRRRCSNA